MSVPDAKALMARAYASGKTPKLLSVVPNGSDEIWVLDEVAFLVPVVPPDAPPLLEYALRLRREALLSGVCDQCGATHGRIEPIDEAYSSKINSAFFIHRSNCPATDEYILPLLDKYKKEHSSMLARDQIASASRKIKEKIVASLGNRFNNNVSSETEEKTKDLLDQRLSTSPMKVCGHLGSRPAQTWNLFLWNEMWRCDECDLRFSESIRTGAFSLNPIEDNSCDFCHRYAPMTLMPSVMRVGIYIMRGAMCRRCAREWGYSEHGSEVKA